ncbi:MAG TPA: hypothetical protein VHE09_03460 [Rhizomicrobium sp.]|nr:hypothetical protein [Rhizomicrobium sp.]
MNKIPLERTIGSAYQFAFRNFLSVLGVLWLPAVVVCAVIAGVIYLTWGDISQLHSLSMQASSLTDSRDALTQQRLDALLAVAGSLGRFGGLIALLLLIARAMVSVGVLRKALGLHEGPIFVYFSLGAPVWRMVGAMILAVLAIVAVSIATCIVAGILYWACQFAPDSARSLLRGILIVVAALWIFYAIIRLVFFLPAVVVAENSIGLGRSWQLGGGNFWRIVAVLIAVLLPVAIVAGILSNSIFGAYWWMEFRQAVQSGQPIPPDQLFASLMRHIGQIWPVWVAFEVIYITLLTGLSLGAIAAAYTNVTRSELPA